jgi:hypothetical protein
MTTLIPKYDQGSTSASNRPINLKLAETVSVKDFGATGDGTTDDTAAIRAAVNAVIASATIQNATGAAGRPTATIYAVYFPAGNYVVSSTIACDNWVNLISNDGARIIISAGVTAFSFAYVNKIQGLSFNGGATAIYYENANIDASRLEISNCDFQLTTSYAINTVGTGATQISGNCIVQDDCRFVNCAKVFYNSFDEATFGGWVEIDCVTGATNVMSANSALFYNKKGYIRFKRLIGVPNVGTDGTRKANIRWIDNYGLGIYADQSRFGGESAGMPIVYNFTPPDTTNWVSPQIVITNSDLYCGLSGQTDNGVVVLGSGGYIPLHITVSNCSGPNTGYWVNNQVAGTNLATYIAAQIAAQPNLSFIYSFGPTLSPGMTNLSTSVGSASDLNQYTVTIQQTPWTNFTLNNSWASIGSPYPAAAYMRDDTGFVHFRGTINTGAIGSYFTILPTQFRPTATINFPVISTNSGPTAVVGWVQIASTGYCTVVQGGTNSTSLDSIIFPTF